MKILDILLDMNVQSLVPNRITKGLLCLVGGVGYCSQKYYPKTKPKLNIKSEVNNTDKKKGDKNDMTKNKKNEQLEATKQKIKELEAELATSNKKNKELEDKIAELEANKEGFEIIKSEEWETETEKFDNIKLNKSSLQLLKDAINDTDSQPNNSSSITTVHL